MSTTNKLTVPFFALLAAASLAAATGCAAGTESPSDDTTPSTEARDVDGAEIGQATSELRISTTLNADGDACTVRTNPDGTTVPGTVKGLECCSTASPDDCVIILKPFPTSYSLRRF